MKSIPTRFEEAWHESEKEEGVKYLLKPFGNIIRSKIANDNTALIGSGKEMHSDFDSSGFSFDSIAFALKGIDGVEGWTPETTTVKLRGGKKTTKLTDECIDVLPSSFYLELIVLVQEINGLSEDEATAIKNMPESPQTADSDSVETVTETTIPALPESG